MLNILHDPKYNQYIYIYIYGTPPPPEPMSTWKIVASAVETNHF